MRTKEEIWHEHFASLHPQNDIKAAAYPAMDEYAKETVNDFINWLYAPLTDRSDLWEQYQQEKSSLK